MRILGIDPGTRKTGWGVIDRKGHRAIGLSAGVIKAPTGELAFRLKKIFDQLATVFEEFSPDVVAVEDIFHAQFANAAMKLGHVRGVVLLAAENRGLEIFSYPPTVVKRTVSGAGRASKDQVAKMVGVILGWDELPNNDATDALAIAITHAQLSKFNLALRARKK